MKANLFRTEALTSKRDHGSQSTLQLRVHHNSYYAPVLIGIALVTLVMWTLYTDIPRTVEVSGAIIPSERPALVTAQKSGIVSSLRVRDGQRVTAGQILAEVNIDSNIDGSGLSARLTELNQSQLELYADEKRQQADAAEIVSRAGTQQVDALVAERKILSSDKESKVAAKFSAQAAQVIANVDGWDKNGQTVSGVLLNNGTTYWDMDSDGKFDLKFERDGAGNVYKDDGDGPVMVHGQG